MAISERTPWLPNRPASKLYRELLQELRRKLARQGQDSLQLFDAQHSELMANLFKSERIANKAISKMIVSSQTD
jgi:hypothetical protein